MKRWGYELTLAYKIVQNCLWIIDSGCSKHMTGNRALLTNFVEKFLGTVRFSNNDFAVIAGYGDVVIGSMTIKKVFFLHSKDEASEVIISFRKTQVNLQLQVQRIRTDNGTEFKNKTLAKFFDDVRITQQFSAARTPQQNGVVKRRNRTLVEAARTMLTFANLPLFLWGEAIAIACFTQNRSIIYKRFDKTPYELINKRKPNIKFFHVFGCRCYLLNDYDDVGKLKAKGDIGVIEPANVAEALKDDDWVSAMQEELDQFARLEIWRLVPRPKGKTIINTKWIFMNKKDEKGIDYDETFARVARIKAICLFLAYAAHKDFTVFQMDVKMVFLNGILKEEVYVGQPLGFVSKQYPDHVYALDKALYGLKQAPQACMMGEMKFFLGLQVNQFLNGIFKNQSKYILDILKRFGMENCETVPTPMVEQAKLKLDSVGKPVDHTDYRSMIGSLMYLTSSSLDIMFATCMRARYQANPNEHHVSAVKRIFRYLKWTINLGIWYPKDFGFDLTAYSDVDHARCHLDRKKSEYVAVSGCCAQVLWMRTQLTDYDFFYDKVPIYYDSQSAIAISCNPVQHTRTKQIDVRYHFIKDHVEKEIIELYFVGTEYQLADLFTKSLPKARFKFLVDKLGMMSHET
ncbi:retrovirus-related pol polyprotein from transposon TNT 1-94 [Tanacetum coccineum]